MIILILTVEGVLLKVTEGKCNTFQESMVGVRLSVEARC